MTNLKTMALLFGVVLLVVGVLGFVPMATPDGYLLGLFQVDTIHNLVHILTGVVGLAAATEHRYAKLYFQVFGIIYAIVAILGFLLAGNLILMHVNMADNVLHLVIALFALFLGFFA